MNNHTKFLMKVYKMNFQMFYNFKRIFRINHYLKNLIILIPTIFLQNILDINSVIKLLLAFLSFSFISSAVYLYNDICDVDSDKMHPIKKFRPLASGIINKTQSYYIIIALILISLSTASLINIYSIIFIVFYFFLNIIYSLFFKKIPFIGDIFIALGFILRILIGYCIFYEDSSYDNHLIIYLILLTFFTVLFFTLCKRKLEIKFSNNNRYKSNFLFFYNKNFYNITITITRILSSLFYLIILFIIYKENLLKINNILLFISFIVFLLILSRYIKIIDNSVDDNISSLTYSDRRMLLYSFFILVVLLVYSLIKF